MNESIDDPLVGYPGPYTYKTASLEEYGDSVVIQLMDVDARALCTALESSGATETETESGEPARAAGESVPFSDASSTLQVQAPVPVHAPVPPVKGSRRTKHDTKRSLHRKEARIRGERLGTAITPKSAKISENLMSAHHLETNLVTVSELPINSGGTYAIDRRTENARRKRDHKEPIPHGSGQPRSKSEWLAGGFGYLSVVPDERPRVVCDRNGGILAVFLGQDDPEYTKAVSKAHEEMIAARRSLNKVPWDPHRGTEPLNTGWYMGTGTKQVVWKRAEHHPELADRLRASDAVRRVVGVGSKHLKYWCPDDHEHLRQLMMDIEHLTGSSERTFPGTVFSMVAFNLGEQSCAVLHRDNGDCHRCAVTAAGDFDASKGGHMVLYDLRLLVEFPHGQTVIFPSGLLTHANTELQPGETRTSIVQYTPGQLSLFRDGGWKTQRSMTKKQLAVRRVEKAALRARFGETFLTIAQVKQRHADSEELNRMERKRQETKLNTRPQDVRESQHTGIRYHPYQMRPVFQSPSQTSRAEQYARRD